jgi:hypothetical protein
MARVAAQAVSSRGAPERRTSLKIMVSTARIRVSPLLKVLQIAEKYGVLAVLPGLCGNGVSTAGSRKGLL